MAKLKTEINVDDPDGFYAKLIELHDGLSQEDSNKINAKIILMLANHVGDAAVLNDVLQYIRQSLDNKQS